ncbi:MAG: hypothetical protein DRR08_20220 [Candidatus Parabeggiatoa sp. nov. 2]|nr:MAG: hypothetical protein B6247_20205 [Beggiatoa sp. 4572_84]RKZ56995.1 MAG: hypothetical protein DRR08_20220 [Gammaproteobacteria bacterium]HEC86076.1 hypothetical protein [Thioploca sp.]
MEIIMQIKISSLRVKNCGALKDIKIDLTDTTGQLQPVTVLGGANGSGKTTVLELIFALAELLKFYSTTDLASIDNRLQAILKRTEYAQMEWLIDNVKCRVFFKKSQISTADIDHGEHGITWQAFYSNTRAWHLQYSDISDKLSQLISLSQGKELCSSRFSDLMFVVCSSPFVVVALAT